LRPDAVGAADSGNASSVVMTDEERERLQKWLDEHTESIECGRRMTPEMLAKEMAERDRKRGVFSCLTSSPT
jgi:hypothetical protein